MPGLFTKHQTIGRHNVGCGGLFRGCWMMAKVARFKAVSVELWGYGGVLDDGR